MWEQVNSPDNNGLDTASATTEPLTVLPNAAPTVGDVQVPTSTVILGNTVTLSVTAGDSDGTIASVNFYNGDVLLGAGALSTGNTYTLAQKIKNGIYVLFFK